MADPSADRCRIPFMVAVSEYREHFPDTGPAAPDGWASAWIRRHSADVPEVAVDLQRYHAGQKVKQFRAEEAVAAEPPTPTYDLEDITFDGEQKTGRMGVVRRGFDRIMKRRIGVKQPQEPYKHSPGHRRRFFREAQLLGQLQHPNILPVYQFGLDTHGTPFFTTPWIDGDTLTDLLARDKGQENVSRFITTFLQVCQAVGFAHGCKILHRDLKPDHVVIDKNGTAVFVVDWGIGKALDAEEVGVNEEAVPENGSSSGIVGTPAYMAPEQATPGATVGPPADVFGLGGILCFILTGAPPAWEGPPEDRGLVSGESSAVRSQLETRRVEHSALVDLAIACLAKKPSDRPQNGAVVAESVQAYLNGITERLIEAEREKAARRAEDQKKAAWWRVRVISAVALLTLVGVAGFVSQWQSRLVQQNHGAVAAPRSL